MSILLRVYLVGATITSVSNGIYAGRQEYNKFNGNYHTRAYDKAIDVTIHGVMNGIIGGVLWPIYVPVLYCMHKRID